jgi:CBS domain-containing protein
MARADEPLLEALSRMIEHDFSQLPIVDDAGKPNGMITPDSILRALNNFGVGLDQLLVGHARVKADIFRDDSDLFELLDRLRDTYAVLIVDGTGCLTGIVTNFDTAEYFRRRAEDMMLVEDVESLLKDYIQAAYKKSEDEIDEARLAEAVQRITYSGTEQRETFERALIHYLTLQEGSGAGFRCFTSEEDFRNYVEVEILALEPA